MKLPRLDFEQKVWIVIGVLIINVPIIIILNLREYTQYFYLSSIISLVIFCTLAKKRNWIKKEMSG